MRVISFAAIATFSLKFRHFQTANQSGEIEPASFRLEMAIDMITRTNKQTKAAASSNSSSVRRSRNERPMAERELITSPL